MLSALVYLLLSTYCMYLMYYEHLLVEERQTQIQRSFMFKTIDTFTQTKTPIEKLGFQFQGH